MAFPISCLWGGIGSGYFRTNTGRVCAVCTPVTDTDELHRHAATNSRAGPSHPAFREERDEQVYHDARENFCFHSPEAVRCNHTQKRGSIGFSCFTFNH